MDYSKENVYSTIHLCWGALAGLYYHFGVRKVHLPEKMFGVFEHQLEKELESEAEYISYAVEIDGEKYEVGHSPNYIKVGRCLATNELKFL